MPFKKNGYSELLPNQGIIIEQYVKGNDILNCSPTGSGKSLIFEMAPFMFQYLENKQKDCTCIVVSPLAALMKAQVQKLTDKGIKAVYLTESQMKSSDLEKNLSEKILKDVSNGFYELIFASPETLLQSNREVLMNLARHGILKVIFIDEAHCIKKFGRSNQATNTPAYRPFYGSLGELRSLAGPTVPVVALTATASKQVKEMILSDLGMNDRVFQLSVDPNKNNIKYWVFETGRPRGDIAMDVNWLVSLLRKEGTKTPRMIIFFRKIDHIADVFEHLETSLGPAAYVNFDPNKTNDDRNRLFDMYHLKTDEEVKESIAASYQSHDGHTRVVLCSTSFSMGLDVKGVNTVIHYGACNDLDDYLQESGRAGRQHSEQCHAIVMKYKQCLSSKNITKDMKEFIKTKACRRKLLLKPFTVGLTISENHNCCDNCAAKCSCLCVNCGPKSCICDIRCPQNTSVIYESMKHHSQFNVDLEEDNFSEGYSSTSDIEEHIVRKPQIFEYSSDDD